MTASSFSPAAKYFLTSSLPPDLDVLCLVMNRAWLLDLASSLRTREMLQQVEGTNALTIPSENVALLFAHLKQIWQSANRESEGRNGFDFEQDIELRVAEAFLSALDERCTLHGLQVTPHKLIADAARGQIMQDTSEPLDIEKLCRQMSISRRHLQNCFQSTFGQSPMQILRAMRLNGARKDILSVIPDARTSIGDIAARWGFWHWSRFTQEYKLFFGELPSETMACRQRHKNAIN
ncbi:helix-turn-helix domain-containing protein [Rhizobium helianthi]|uniref:Helix-turn-helix domain-containing protein n=1 Tax=Rhizobium helianthi TaxID=1132695 RepID=A0ABW4M816_9HYPH